MPGGVVADALMGTGIVGLAWAAGLPLAGRPTRPPATGRGLFVPVAFGALALGENHTLLAASRVEAATDPLTGLSNRRRLGIDLARVLEDNTPHALLLLDLNGFKTDNDSYGHGAGDILLHQLGSARSRRTS